MQRHIHTHTHAWAKRPRWRLFTIHSLRFFLFRLLSRRMHVICGCRWRLIQELAYTQIDRRCTQNLFVCRHTNCTFTMAKRVWRDAHENTTSKYLKKLANHPDRHMSDASNACCIFFSSSHHHTSDWMGSIERNDVSACEWIHSDMCACARDRGRRRRYSQGCRHSTAERESQK